MLSASQAVVPQATGPSPSVKATKFAALLFIFEVFIVLCYGFSTDYLFKGDPNASDVTELTQNGDGGVIQYYMMFSGVHIMIFIDEYTALQMAAGAARFGFLMTFLHSYSWSAVGYNFLLSAIAVQWSILTQGFFHNAVMGSWHKISLSISELILGDFAAGALMISFGAVLGKVSATQLLVMTFFEMVVYAINEAIVVKKLLAVDMGGSMIIHTFGAYFGLAVSWMIGNPAEGKASPKYSKWSSTLAMVGTIFLWVYWPSFNAAMAAISGAQYRVIINTVLSICGSCISAFYAGRLLRPGKKFDFEELQNATLAGGVAVGSSSDLAIHPWGALLLGNVAGIVSTAGFVFLSPLVDRYLKIHDTCGVHNLHGMPGLLGGIAGAISASTATVAAYGGETILHQIFTGRDPAVKGWDATTQGAYQFAGLMVSVAFAIAGGLLTGFIMRWKIWDPLTADFYEDVSEWTTEHLDGDLNGKTGGHGDLENGHGASPAAGTGAHGSGLEMVGTKHAASAREADPEAVHAVATGVDVVALVQAEVRRALEAAGVHPASPSSVAAPAAAGTPSAATPVAATNV